VNRSVGYLCAGIGAVVILFGLFQVFAQGNGLSDSIVIFITGSIAIVLGLAAASKDKGGPPDA